MRTTKQDLREQKLPTNRAEREKLRIKGQFWTPTWLAEGMAIWVTGNGGKLLFDPAVGPGTFFSAARGVGYNGRFAGCELDSDVLVEAMREGLTTADLSNVAIQDFLTSNINVLYPCIISNPPYIRHHRLTADTKAYLRQLAQQYLGCHLDGRVGLHVYFLLKALHLLEPGGRLAFLLPADVCEGVSSTKLWQSISERFCLEATVTFDEDGAPFPNVDTNAMVFLLSKTKPKKTAYWACVSERSTKAFLQAAGAETNGTESPCVRKVTEMLETGLSRRKKTASEASGVPLCSFARVMRGIATGANEYFFMTRKDIEARNLPYECFVRAVGRTRDCPQAIIDHAHLDALDASGRPTWLLSLDKTVKHQLPPTVQEYLKIGERAKLHNRALIKSRKPWYAMEVRTVPPILFAYLGRRDSRFIKNEAACVPLTGFLCVYPKQEVNAAALFSALNHPDTIANLKFAGKSYGNGALKLEPRQLDRVLIPNSVLKLYGITYDQT